MRNSTRKWLLIISTFFFSQLQAQQPKDIYQKAISLISKNVASLGLSLNDVQNIQVSSTYFNGQTNTQMVYLQQVYKGIPVYNSIQTIAFRNDEVVSKAGSRIGKMAVKTNSPQGVPIITPASAVVKAATHLNLEIKAAPEARTMAPDGSKVSFGLLGISREEVTAQLQWFPIEDGSVKLGWQIKIDPNGTDDHWLLKIDALNGNYINKENLTIFCNWGNHQNHSGSNTNSASPSHQTSGNNVQRLLANSTAYRVVPFPAESPAHVGGTPALVTNPWEMAGTGHPAVTLGWHNDGFTDYSTTRGNNVWAKEDRDADNEKTPGLSATSTSASPHLTFDFPFDPDKAPTNTSNQKAILTNLFYWNNITHDLSYLYGFTEAAGNFQSYNSGRGGIGGDYVLADAQDGKGVNNANFYTPPDGETPRMQMYLFTRKFFQVNSPSSFAGLKSAEESTFSTANKLEDVGPVSGNVVLYVDTDGTNSEACTATTGSYLQGKIALIYRGNCTFVEKVKNAQNAGAIAVIMVQNTDGSPTVMSGTDNTITIPALMISQSDGNQIKQSLTSGTAVTITLKKNVGIDGDLDNGIIVHEYAHGISTRLTGGPAISTCLLNQEQMGEGWSDYFALMLTTNWSTATINDGPKKRTIGTYVYDQDPITGGGIRHFPYSTDLDVFRWTYSSISTNTFGEEHAIGEIWAATLWDMTWSIIAMDGINTNLYNPNATGGNTVALKLVTEAMKLQPCSPGFLDGRDAILKADTLLYNGKYGCAIWSAFARRGMGINAKQGNSNSYTDQVANTNIPSEAIVKKSVSKAVAGQQEQITYTLTSTCQCSAISNYKIVDTLPANVTYISGGNYNAGNRTVTFNVSSLAASQSQSFSFVVAANAGSYNAPVELFNENVTASSIPNNFSATTSSAKPDAKWSVTNSNFRSAPSSLKANNSDSNSVQTLTSASAFNISGISTLSFWHKFETEAGFDGGVVEISKDNGETWIDVGPYIIQQPYNLTVYAKDSVRKGFSGSSNGDFIQTVVNLSALKTGSIKLRFAFYSDDYIGGDGWYIDDINLTSESGIYNIAGLFNSSDQLKSTSDTFTRLINLLPITLSSFTVEKQGTKALLKWTTAQEQNADKFVLERSKDGVTFEVIGSLNAKGGNQTSAYLYIDQLPSTGINYYRIKQVDTDTRATYSTLRNLTFDNYRNAVTIAPNPARGKVNISIPGNNALLQIAFVSTTGQRIKTYTMAGENMQLQLPVVASGVYYIQIEGNGMSSSHKVVIQ